ncbi:MAG: glycosyltransferase, partial [Vicinamibacterales bacterium]
MPVDGGPRKRLSYWRVTPLVSVIIPVRHDAESLARLLAQLLEGGTEPEGGTFLPRAKSRGVPPNRHVEIIVCTAGDDDPAINTLSHLRSDVSWVHSTAGRATQLNAGAAHATGEWLWFVHADSVLPDGWLDAFRGLDAIGGPKPETGNRKPPVGGLVGGSFRFALSSDAWQARIIERAVAGRVKWLHLPYGDQGIFVRRAVFLSMKGFAPLPLLEDVEFVGRLKRLGTLRHLTLSLTTSARRW